MNLSALCMLEESSLRPRPEPTARADVDRVFPGLELREREGVKAAFEDDHTRGGFLIAEDRDRLHTALGKARRVFLPILFPSLFKPHDIASLGIAMREVGPVRTKGVKNGHIFWLCILS